MKKTNGFDPAAERRRIRKGELPDKKQRPKASRPLTTGHRALLHAAHSAAIVAARRLGRAMPGQYEGFRKDLVAAEARFARAVRRYVA